MNARSRSILFALWIIAFLANVSLAETINMEMVTIGNPGNANDSTGYGAVAYEYRIGKYEVTIGQYTAFLNAVAKADTYGLYHDYMSSIHFIAGIARSGSAGSYTYTPIGPTSLGVRPPGASSPENRPITYVSWWDAARFANWMHNGQPIGSQGASTTETGAYNLNGATSGAAPGRSAGARFFIPTESEWYKAAYYSPLLNTGSGGYYRFATQSNIAPGNLIGGGANQANYSLDNSIPSVTQSSVFYTAQNYLTDVGAFINSGSYYGTFDQSGNVNEWIDFSLAAGSGRGIRGGSWRWGESSLSSAARTNTGPGEAGSGTTTDGFRLASTVAVPEPSTYAMALAGLACGGYTMFRRRKRA
jgi:sulfatase modifying factor 1